MTKEQFESGIKEIEERKIPIAKWCKELTIKKSRRNSRIS